MRDDGHWEWVRDPVPSGNSTFCVIKFVVILVIVLSAIQFVLRHFLIFLAIFIVWKILSFIIQRWTWFNKVSNHIELLTFLFLIKWRILILHDKFCRRLQVKNNQTSEKNQLIMIYSFGKNQYFSIPQIMLI